ncbi:MAG TPA: DUF4258 domain-containing protein [Candidatus Paceibacterota bacterium]
MNYYLTPHAKRRIKERKIPEKLIRSALQEPTRVLYDDKGRILFKKLYQKQNKERLLLVAAEAVNDRLEIITIIDTSKVKKYL